MLHCFGLALLGTCLSITTVSPQELQPKDMARVKKLEESLLAPCCYGEPVSRHMSEVAFQMREEIVERVQAGQSDQDILEHYKLLYGEQVLVARHVRSNDLDFLALLVRPRRCQPASWRAR